MSKMCDLCQKGYQKGNLVPRGIGRRVTKRTIVMKQVNLRSKRFIVNGTSMKLSICSSCLKRINFEDKLVKTAAATVKA